MKEKYKDNILKLRSQGFTYNQIVKELGCARSTITYHCGNGHKDKGYKRMQKHKSSNRLRFYIVKKITQFKIVIELSLHKILYISSFKKRIKQKCLKFCGVKSIKNMEVTPEDIISKLESNPYCELTGRPLNLEETSSWNLDHIVPRCKGGSNNLDNCQIVCKDANQAKSGLLTEDFIQLCIDVLKHHKYTIIKE